MSATVPAPAATARVARGRPALSAWWPLAGLMILAAALRFSTLDMQSFWYDEAFTPVHVLHASLWATLRAVSHTENTPPLWYVIAWADARLLGTGEVALRLPSAIAGVLTVPVAWAIGRELAGRRTAVLTAALVAVNPLLVWYSQEARAYSLFVLAVALAMLCFLRAERDLTPARLWWFALTGSLALLTHYFAVFLLIPMVLLLARKRPDRDPKTRRAALGALGVLVLVGAALVGLVSAQAGHGTQWIGRWALSSRLQAIPQYYLTGASGAPLGHAIELLVALPIIAGIAFGLLRAPSRAQMAGADAEAIARARRGAVTAALIAGGGILIPVLLVAFGADYLAPRNLVAAMIPLTALIAVIVVSPRAGRAGSIAGALIALAFLAISIDVNLSPRLQRGNWRAVAQALRVGARPRVITTVELGGAPLEYYLAQLRNLPVGSSVTVREIDETGYSPLRESAGRPPAGGFHLLARLDIDGLVVYRFVSPVPRTVSEATLRRRVITLAHPEVLVGAPPPAPRKGAQALPARVQMSSPVKKI